MSAYAWTLRFLLHWDSILDWYEMKAFVLREHALAQMSHTMIPRRDRRDSLQCLFTSSQRRSSRKACASITSTSLIVFNHAVLMLMHMIRFHFNVFLLVVMLRVTPATVSRSLKQCPQRMLFTLTRMDCHYTILYCLRLVLLLCGHC